MMLTQEKLKELFTYDSNTGIFTWNVDRGRNKVKGKEITTKSNHGYIQTSYNNNKIRMHRMAWIYVYGNIPYGYEIDHINHDRSDNRISNLRAVEQAENKRNCSLSSNNKSGFNGVFFDSSRNLYLVTVGKKFIGRYKTLDEAVEKRKEAENKQGFHINHGIKEVA